jgi:hypothetical protein
VPTVIRIGPYRFFFYSNEEGEPPHIHIQRDRSLAKFWLGPVDIASSTGFPAHELSKLPKLVVEHESRLMEAWNEYFGN